MSNVRRVHYGDKVAPNGGISPLCANTPRRIDMKHSTWTRVTTYVTCPRCKKMLAERKEAA